MVIIIYSFTEQNECALSLEPRLFIPDLSGMESLDSRLVRTAEYVVVSFPEHIIHACRKVVWAQDEAQYLFPSCVQIMNNKIFLEIQLVHMTWEQCSMQIDLDMKLDSM